mmetsp:Transcript_15247/g.24711  ORF Transcript_15247/g.24711 Transcript_15247/m.24711 type:complete len:358 (+) Transcript_15247:1133-2206(+)
MKPGSLISKRKSVRGMSMILLPVLEMLEVLIFSLVATPTTLWELILVGIASTTRLQPRSRPTKFLVMIGSLTKSAMNGGYKDSKIRTRVQIFVETLVLTTTIFSFATTMMTVSKKMMSFAAVSAKKNWRTYSGMIGRTLSITTTTKSTTTITDVLTKRSKHLHTYIALSLQRRLQKPKKLTKSMSVPSLFHRSFRTKTKNRRQYRSASVNCRQSRAPVLAKAKARVKVEVKRAQRAKEAREARAQRVVDAAATKLGYAFLKMIGEESVKHISVDVYLWPDWYNKMNGLIHDKINIEHRLQQIHCLILLRKYYLLFGLMKSSDGLVVNDMLWDCQVSLLSTCPSTTGAVCSLPWFCHS